MRVAALYDIHGNLPALESVLDAIYAEGADLIVVGGDVLPGPMPRETLDCLRATKIPAHFVMGNGDRDALTMRADGSSAAPEAYQPMMRWVAAQLTEAHVAWMSQWADTTELQLDDLRRVLFCHATPWSNTQIFTERTPDARVRRLFNNAHADIVICGHTHMQFDRVVEPWRIVNAGSVGMPFGERGAYWLSLDGEVHLRRTEYDYEKAAARIRATAYPRAEEFAAMNVLSPPSAAAMLAVFET